MDSVQNNAPSDQSSVSKITTEQNKDQSQKDVTVSQQSPTKIPKGILSKRTLISNREPGSPIDQSQRNDILPTGNSQTNNMTSIHTIPVTTKDSHKPAQSVRLVLPKTEKVIIEEEKPYVETAHFFAGSYQNYNTKNADDQLRYPGYDSAKVTFSISENSNSRQESVGNLPSNFDPRSNKIKNGVYNQQRGYSSQSHTSSSHYDSRNFGTNRDDNNNVADSHTSYMQRNGQNTTYMDATQSFYTNDYWSYDVEIFPWLNSKLLSKYFNISTGDFCLRSLASLIFFKPVLVQAIGEVPDQYGPIWIYNTLIMILGLLGNFSSYLKQDVKDQSKFLFDFRLISQASFFIYFVGFLTPMAICIQMRALGSKAHPVTIISIYGYGYFVYILAFLIVPFITIDVRFLSLIKSIYNG